MGVNLGSFQVFVPQQILHRAYVRLPARRSVAKEWLMCSLPLRTVIFVAHWIAEEIGG